MVDSRNKANGVTLADGTEIKAKVVLSNATPKVTYLDLLHAVSMLPSTVIKLMFGAVVDGVYKTWIFIQCSCLIAPLPDYMNRHCEEQGCSFMTPEGRSPIGIMRLYLMWLLTRSHNMINHGLHCIGYDDGFHLTGGRLGFHSACSEKNYYEKHGLLSLNLLN